MEPLVRNVAMNEANRNFAAIASWFFCFQMFAAPLLREAETRAAIFEVYFEAYTNSSALSLLAPIPLSIFSRNLDSLQLYNSFVFREALT